MAITVNERVESRESTDGESPSENRSYFIDGTNDETAAKTALASTAPLVLTGMVRKNYTVEPIGDPLLSEQWTGSVTYGPEDSGSSKPPVSGSNYLAFDTGSSNVNITQSISTQQSAAVSGTATDRNRAINSSKEGTAGVDIVAPELRFSKTKYFDYDFVDSAYLNTLTELAGTVNNALFDIFPAGEVLFLNASGSRRGTDQSSDGWEITFNFAVQKTVAAGYSPAPGITFASAIEGWDYIWVSYQSKKDATNNIRVSAPVEAYVERIYERTDFSLLQVT
jgi:hypothetical protein